MRLVEIGRWTVGTCGRRRKSNFVFGGSVVAVLITVRGPERCAVAVLEKRKCQESFTQASVPLLILGVFLLLSVS